MRTKLLMFLVAVSMGAGCAHHVPEPAVSVPGMPHISWVIMSGDSDNPDREFVCQSEPRGECVVPVSKPDAQVFSDVHVYYHGAGAETRYAGSIQIGYFRGDATANTVKSDVIVKKTESITNQSVSNIVTSTPGTYSVNLAHVATVTDTKTTLPIQEKIAVVVR
jgi:hypothetical protein